MPDNPIWPGKPMTAHWGIPDPAAAEGTPSEVVVAFNEATRLLRNRINVFVEIPIQRLDAMSLKNRLDAIGRG